MSQLAGISGREAVRKFIRLGYQMVRQRGSHARLKHFDAARRPLTIPLHRELKIGLLAQLIKDAGITVKNFLEL